MCEWVDPGNCSGGRLPPKCLVHSPETTSSRARRSTPPGPFPLTLRPSESGPGWSRWAPRGPAGTATTCSTISGTRAHSLDEPHLMIWGTPRDTTWVWQLDARPDGTTRVVTRIRSRIRWTPRSIAYSALVEVADIWMIRKMLLNLRDRAERRGSD